jgi:hypothetical protein
MSGERHAFPERHVLTSGLRDKPGAQRMRPVVALQPRKRRAPLDDMSQSLRGKGLAGLCFPDPSKNWSRPDA